MPRRWQEEVEEEEVADNSHRCREEEGAEAMAGHLRPEGILRCNWDAEAIGRILPEDQEAVEEGEDPQ